MASWRSLLGSFWRAQGFAAARPALVLFLVQLVFNGLWSWLFFAWHQGGLAFIEIAALWLLIVATVISFFDRDFLAGLLLIPYLLWVSFATALNYTVWQMNPAAL